MKVLSGDVVVVTGIQIAEHEDHNVREWLGYVGTVEHVTGYQVGFKAKGTEPAYWTGFSGDHFNLSLDDVQLLNDGGEDAEAF